MPQLAQALWTNGRSGTHHTWQRWFLRDGYTIITVQKQQPVGCIAFGFYGLNESASQRPLRERQPPTKQETSVAVVSWMQPAVTSATTTANPPCLPCPVKHHTYIRSATSHGATTQMQERPHRERNAPRKAPCNVSRYGRRRTRLVFVRRHRGVSRVDCLFLLVSSHCIRLVFCSFSPFAAGCAVRCSGLSNSAYPAQPPGYLTAVLRR